MRVKSIEITKPAKIKYDDPEHKILLVTFDDGREWCPTMAEFQEIDMKFNECHQWNLYNDKQGKKFWADKKKKVYEMQKKIDDCGERLVRRSSCCNAGISRVGSQPEIVYYVCASCGKPCATVEVPEGVYAETK